jgi:hypothetical protein
MIIILRGHIRQSFNNKDLYDLIKYLSLNYDIKIYIHTWNIMQSNISWRRMDKINREIDELVIYEYFNDIHHLIKKIIIDNDTQINVIGNRHGNICKSLCPTVAWKYMWYGKYHITESIPKDTIEPIVNIRFDILNNSYSLSFNDVINFINNNINDEYRKNIFRENIPYGVDNIYIGNIHTMSKLANHFYYNLDRITMKYPHCGSQELLVYWENNVIF